MSKNKSFIIKILVVVALLVTIVCLYACGDARNIQEESSESGIDNPEIIEPAVKEKVNKLKVYIDEDFAKTELEYYSGTIIKFKAPDIDLKTFVCWVVNGEFYSTTQEIEYTVESSAVIKAMYSKEYDLSINLTKFGKYNEEAGTTTETTVDDDVITVKSVFSNIYFSDRFSSVLAEKVSTVYDNYYFMLPVPKMDNYTFLGWYDEEYNQITDNKGRSVNEFNQNKDLEVIPLFKENKFINIVILSSENEEQITQKVYVEDLPYSLNAEQIHNRQFNSWWFVNEDETETLFSEESLCEISKNSDVIKNVKNGATIKYRAKYIEAYYVRIKGGQGSGYYQKNDDITIRESTGRGFTFEYWELSVDNTTYKFAQDINDNVVLIVGDNVYCLNDSEEVVIKTVGEVELKNELNSIIFKLSDLVKLEVDITKDINLKTITSKKDYLLQYKLDCSDVLEEEIPILDDIWERQPNSKLFIYTTYLNYNDELSLETIRNLEHYKFSSWRLEEGSANGEKMPAEDCVYYGFYKPNDIKVKVNNVYLDNGELIGTSTIITNNSNEGTFAYGRNIEISIVAEPGYIISTIDNALGESIIPTGNLDSVVGDKITYTSSYGVNKDISIYPKFTKRTYTINYVTRIMYDGVDIKNDESVADKFFASKNDEKIQWSENVLYQDDVVLTNQYSANDIGLKHTGFWNLSGWDLANVEFEYQKNNTQIDKMPSSNITVYADYTIFKFDIRTNSDSTNTVDNIVINTVNDKDSETYYNSETEKYEIPYLSELKITINMKTGTSLLDVNSKYSYGNESNSFDLYGVQDIDYSSDNSGGRYEYVLTYNLQLENDPVVGNLSTIRYSFGGLNESYHISYYINWDYDNLNPLMSIDNFINYNNQIEEEVNNQSYYKLNMANTNSIASTIDVTNITRGYNVDLELATINGTVNEYNFYSWDKYTKNSSGEYVSYNSSKMPDEDIYCFSTLRLNTYDLRILTNSFRFDGESSTLINTAVIESVEYNNQEVDIDNIESLNEITELKYYSKIKIRQIVPTGYNFAQFKDGNTSLENSEVGGGYLDYKYTTSIVNDINEIEIYVTKDLSIESLFNIKTFTATFDDSTNQYAYNYLRIASKNGDIIGNLSGSSKTITFSFGDQIQLQLEQRSTSTRYSNKQNSFGLGRGDYINNIKVKNAGGTTLVDIDTEFKNDSYDYKNTIINTNYDKTNEDQYSGFDEDIVIYFEKSSINYKIKYEIFGIYDNGDLSEQTPWVIEEEAGYDEFSTNWTTSAVNLLSSEDLLEILENKGYITSEQVNELMFGGWLPINVTKSVLLNDYIGVELGQTIGQNYTNTVSQVNGIDFSYISSSKKNQYGFTETSSDEWGWNKDKVFTTYLLNMYKFEESTSYNGILIKYNYNLKDNANIQYYLKNSITTLTIPTTHNSTNIVEVGEFNTSNTYSGLTDLIINDNIKKIDDSAFSGATSLVNVTFGDG
ncbi:MAG: hypothetical protein K5765_09525, partial [Clostridia bacterium]|nr:hypothetical protein [Clostridia bacterium]